MKTFKQFVDSIANLKESYNNKLTFIVNCHGKHAQKQEQYKNPYYNMSESEEFSGPAEGTWEHFKAQNHNPQIPTEHNFKDQMAYLNENHPLNPEFHKVIRHYTSESSGLSDLFLRHHNKGTKPPRKTKKHDIETLDRALDSHTLNKPITTFTGTGFNPEKLDSNKVVTHLSSSINPMIASLYTKPDFESNPGKQTHHIIKHELHPGMKALVVGRAKDESGFNVSTYSTEDEVILPRTDATKEKYELHFNGYKDYPNQFGHIVRVHNGVWKPTTQGN